jgi:biopolymer transport protein ExbB
MLQESEEQGDEQNRAASKPSGIDLLSLITQGGGFMIPIGLMSMLVVTLAVERLLSLRRKRLMPKRLVRGLQELSDPIDRFNPSAALSLCRDYPSPAATAIEAMLMRTGQPLGEVERAATEAVQREADDYAAPIRWLSLAAAATPLMGLLGTVWGMIVAFHESTTLTPDRSRSEQLSEGIYTALVTTLAGLVVAIPAAIFAQYLENRLAKYFHRIERLAFSIAPGLTRFVGRARLDSDGTLRSIKTPSGSGQHAAAPSSTASPLAAPPLATPPVAGVGAGAVAKSGRSKR